MILIYSRPSCGPCKTLKYWLSKKNLPFVEFDVDEHMKDVTALTGAELFQLPVVVVGEQIIQGANFGALQVALQSNQT